MPAKNSLKTYRENGFYHIYNRGVEKRDIFLDEQDFSVFISYLKIYLNFKDTKELGNVISSPDCTAKEKDIAFKLLHLKNYFEEIILLCYALMPNHFHLLIKQVSEQGMNFFVRSLTTKYSMYFNKKYHRVGSLFQGVYKAVPINSDEQLLHVSRYIHLNPPKSSNFPSSLPEYVGLRNTSWVHNDIILAYFNRSSPQNSYASFMGENQIGEFIAPLALDFID